MPERIVVVGCEIGTPDGEREEGYALFDRYKDTWVQEVMDENEAETGNDYFSDDLFWSYEDYMKFWGTDDLCYATGSVYAKRYKNWTKEDEDFYAKFVEDAEENAKNNIKILKPSWDEYKRVKRRLKMKWADLKK